MTRHLDALLAQTQALDEIIVVDNGSSDGTAAFLAEHYPQVTVVRLEDNVGMAGGWAAGLEFVARNRSHEWIWSFDDDSVPAPELLEKLLTGAGALLQDESLGMVAPIPVEPGTGLQHEPRLRCDKSYKLGVRAPVELTQQPVWFADLAICSGLLIRRAVIARIGPPRAAYYMDFFDHEYCLRARAAGFKIAVISGCEMAHTIGQTRRVRVLGKTPAYIFQPPWREYYMARNLVHAVLRVPELRIKKRVAVGELLHRGCLTVFCAEHRALSLARMMQGVLDGARGRLGIRFRPTSPNGQNVEEQQECPL